MNGSLMLGITFAALSGNTPYHCNSCGELHPEGNDCPSLYSIGNPEPGLSPFLFEEPSIFPSRDSHISGSYQPSEIASKLAENYQNYNWRKKESRLTSDISGHRPVEMYASDFPQDDLNQALANIGSTSTYPGCGRVAVLGVLDYLARYLNYSELISNPTSSSQRIAMAEEVYRLTPAIEISPDAVYSGLSDVVNGFNAFAAQRGLGEKLSANGTFTHDEGAATGFWRRIESSVNKGLPATLMTSFFSYGQGPVYIQADFGVFNSHYANIYGYEKWEGIDPSSGEIKEKFFLVARPNHYPDNSNAIACCDAEILNYPFIGLVDYQIAGQSVTEMLTAAEFSDFVSPSNNGFYYRDPRSQTVQTQNGEILNTERKRCSYIENQYLVLSPNRSEAGEAYLEIDFPTPIEWLEFDSALWSGQEGVSFGGTTLERFYIETRSTVANSWMPRMVYDLTQFSTLRNYPNHYKVLLPKGTQKIRFAAYHSSPSGERNKGRIILDNISYTHD